MKIKIIAISFIGLIGCTESIKEENKSETLETIVEQIDTVIVDVEKEEPQEEPQSEFAYFEDYAAITTKENLIKQFGEIAIIDGESWYAEGTVKMEHSILVNPKNGDMIKYLWNEDGKTLSSIEASYYMWDENFETKGKQVLKTKDGLRLGMSLDELKEWNGADIKFSGFGWDYAGNVFVDADSKLAKSMVHITLLQDVDARAEGFDFIIGDVELNTSDTRLMGAPILVQQFTYNIEK